MQVVNRKKEITYAPLVLGKHSSEIRLNLISQENNRETYTLSVSAPYTSEAAIVKFKLKAIGARGSWTSNAILDKRIRTDWEMPQVETSISNDAPIISLFGQRDENLISVACADAVNNIKWEGSLREEDNHLYCALHFFTENFEEKDYETKIVIDRSSRHFSTVIQELSDWILSEDPSLNAPTPTNATVPLYSTWYSFHQSLDEEVLLEECRLSKRLGYDLIIIDDGWQTFDDGRGYDYTGDWEPERFPNPTSFVQKVHDEGMTIMFWYAVPFCGKKSKAYQKFKGKFLTEEHYWAPVFDPRFPEVRTYIVDSYKRALTEWNIDGFKLDFIDEFKVYPETEINHLNGRDTISISRGTELLIAQISDCLRAIKPDVLIEFRQKYISPALHRLGNMFRAFDCPNDSLMNRVRTTDVKLICGKKAVHSDMLTWHKEEPIEMAALQFSSILFSVPQLSVRLSERSEKEIEMIRFYTSYWRRNKDILLNGHFKAYNPLANYPSLSASNSEHIIYGLYDDQVLSIDSSFDTVHIVNGKISSSIILRFNDSGKWQRTIVDCLGNERSQEILEVTTGLADWDCPANGIIFLEKKSAS